MENTPTIWTTATEVVSNVITMLGTVSNALMSNQLFQITIGIVLLGIVMGIVYGLLRKLRKRGK